jgi:hypothetical protein
MGITTPVLPEENTSGGRFVGMGSGYDFATGSWRDPNREGTERG